MRIKISKVANELNIGISTIVEYFRSKGVEVENNPNYRLNEEQVNDLKQNINTFKRVDSPTSDIKVLGKIDLSTLNQSTRPISKKSNRLKNEPIKSVPTNESSISKKYIGLVKFFDKNKGFGFITCYRGDYHVTDSSFNEDAAKEDRKVVVFELINGRAKNIREYNKESEEDYHLALSYYYDKEEIETEVKYKSRGRVVNITKEKINLFNKLGVKRKDLLPILKKQLEDCQVRNGDEAFSYFKYLVNRYKIDLDGGKRYIFSLDYENENRTLWEDIFALLNNFEWVKILNEYPPAVLFVNDDKIIVEWFKNYEVDVDKIRSIKDFDYTLPLLKESFQHIYTQKFKEAVDVYILNYIQKCKERDSIRPGIGNSTELDMILHKLRPYTDRSFETEITDCKDSIYLKEFNEDLSRYKNYLKDSYYQNRLLQTYKKISEPNRPKSVITETFYKLIESYIESNNFNSSFEVIAVAKKFEVNFAVNYISSILNRIEIHLEDKVDYLVKNFTLRDFNDFENEFSRLKDYFPESQQESLRKKISDKILTSENFDLQVRAADSTYKWVNADKIIKSFIENIQGWDSETIKNFILHNPIKSSLPIEATDILFRKALSLLKEELYSIYNSDKPLLSDTNLSFIRKILSLKREKESNILWDNLLSSMKLEDVLYLYNYEDIKYILPEHLKSIFKEIAKHVKEKPVEYWDKRQFFIDHEFQKALRNEENDIFIPITDVIKEIEINKDNIGSIIYLLELLDYNKPESNDYWDNKKWDESFNKKLTDFYNSIASDLKMKALLWGVHLKTPGAITGLSEIFTWLPPYLQIKIVKRLFSFIDQGRLSYNAQSLYDLLTSPGEKLYLPIEILFAYLKLREKEPSRNFNNAEMHKLLLEYKFHNQWLYIREFVQPCKGRVIRSQNPNIEKSWRDNTYFNGALGINKNTNNIEFFLPYRMIDEKNYIQSQYNNKYFNSLKTLIELHFKPNDDYSIEQLKDGIKYHFNESYQKDLIFLFRGFNINNHLLSSFSLARISEHSNNDPDGDIKIFCECRLDNKVTEPLPFYWCENKPCYNVTLRFHTPDEWESYTILDFMRILGIPYNYTNKKGETNKYGYFTILSSFFQEFYEFYGHLKCQCCNKLLVPKDLGNYGRTAVTEFICNNQDCNELNKPVYLNHCFNRPKCRAIIDSRDSKTCTNGQYICPDCGGCCSTENFRRRIDNLKFTGGYISARLISFVEHNLGHWEIPEFFCYKCGKSLGESKECKDCNITYNN